MNLIKSTGSQCNYHFKNGDIVICRNNIGRSEFTVGKEYTVIESIREYNSDNLVVCDEHRIYYPYVFASRFTTLKIERKEKLKKMEKCKSLEKVNLPDGEYKGLLVGL